MTVEARSEAAPRSIPEGHGGDGRGGGSVGLAVVRYGLLLAAGLLTGAVFCVWLMEMAFRGDGSFFTEMKQLQISALAGPLPVLGLATLVFGFVHLFLARGDIVSFRLTLAGVLCFAVGLFVTVWAHFPVNAEIMAWQIQSPPEGWAEAAARWSFAHDVRTLFTALGFGLFLAGVLRPVRKEAT